MPKSQFVSADQLKPLVAYFAIAFIVVLAVSAMVPAGRVKNLLVVAWIFLFPVGGWLVFRRG